MELRPRDDRSRESWHALPAEDVARKLGTDIENGLSAEQVRLRPTAGTIDDAPLWRQAAVLFAHQWKGSIILVLCASSLAFWFLDHRSDSIGIAFSVVFAVVLGFLTDFRSQRSLATLKSLNAPVASVIRAGVMIEIPSGSVVQGDIAVLRGGSVIPADGRIVSASELQVQEAALTGESAAVAKTPETLSGSVSLAERANMVYAGTTAVTGSARMIVTDVGLDTEIGRIGRLVKSQEKEETPLELQVEALGRRLALLIVGLCACTTVIGLILGQPLWDMLETGLLLAIAAIPEGLPAVNTVALAGGVARMVRARSIVRRLAAVEVLGSVDVVCTDKTGTLTENVMRVAVVCTPGRRLEVSGSGYTPDGRFSEGTTPIDPRKTADLQRVLWIAALCNNAVLESHDGWHVHGLPTEGALLTLAAQGGYDLDTEKRRHTRISEMAFTSVRKRMSVVVSGDAGARWVLAKGAVGALLPLCDRIQSSETESALTPAAGQEIRREAERLGAQGLRVLGFAYRRIDAVKGGDSESGLIWCGMVGLLDPPRRNAAQAVKDLAGAGIRTIMVTGDQKDTATAIAARLGLAVGERGARDAHELADILARKAWAELDEVSVFARVSPEDKLRLVEGLKSQGHVVAMTGDGINDAPALKAANIGVAMGSGSADVAKEAADLVITDGEYATLTTAVEEGRRIYANLQRATDYLLLCSLGNIGLMVGAIALRLPLAMTALQLLWLNLVIHVFPAISLAVAPNPRRFLDESPRSPSATLLGWPQIFAVGRRSLVVAAAALAVFAINLSIGVDLARTLALTALGLSLLLQTFAALSPAGLGTNVRSAGWTVGAALLSSMAILLAMLYFPPLSGLLKTVPLTATQWIQPSLAALFCLTVLGLAKKSR